jgi:hypothetical protein
MEPIDPKKLTPEQLRHLADFQQEYNAAAAANEEWRKYFASQRGTALDPPKLESPPRIKPG